MPPARKRPKTAETSQPLPQSDLLYRSAEILIDGVDRENRSLPLVLATESPVQTYDLSRMEVVDEVIRMEGMEVPSQVPLLDSHERDSTRHVLGSIRDLSVKNGQLIGRAYFANDETSRNTFEKYADGHLTDFSVGARRLQREYKDGRLEVTRSQLLEGSAVVVGADRNAKAMLALRAYAEPHQLKEELMDAKLKELLIERGLKEDATDKETLDFLSQELERKESPIDPAVALDIVRQLKTKTEEPKKPDVDLDEVKRAERARVFEIEQLCRKGGVEDETRRTWIESDMTAKDVAHEILKRELKPVGPIGGSNSVEVIASERDKFYEAARHGVIQRSLGNAKISDELKEEIGAAPAAAKDFRWRRIPDIAREFCERSGMQVDKLPQQEIVRRAIQIDEFVTRSSDGQSFHTTGSFSNLFLDAMHKRLRAAYDEAPSTYQRWVRQAESASDFRTLHRIVFGEIGIPDEVAENGIYPEMTAGDSRENYRVKKHGGIFSVSLEMMVNDDLDAMMRIPRMQGNSMRRKINRDAYSILVDNDPLTADSIALFHASSHGANLDSTALSESALDVGYSVMMTQSGLNSTTVLNIMPRFLIVGAALSATAYRTTGGGVVPETVSNVPLYGPGGPRSLEVIVDGQIDSLGSATNWWLAADNSTVDTVEITFLQGEETPVLDREEAFTTDAIKYKIRQTYAVKAIDYRGLYQGNS